ncbi:similar to catechol 1,2-dioxygenase [Plenodomus lingam JN3]|uniref:Similar to catechol 1,2-dioxygenase n=1 Tax=Leptosphaeria maculans (strain JN3 / isolate v23.1.3 / race Av1-4-5-6-7-8) TaxID=985895 RepID=E4ZI69_LEPMJ|nr:similar to catechol 1,2-dioxygenase [Plenodomus lingam JN3]CBX91212.1 similar to catechol 1,2-dioxygenase [Plenodomus lingam JN3]
MTSNPAPKAASTVPELKNLTIDNITENVHRINSQCADPRLKYVMERLVSHLHDFARETRLSFDEWMAGIKFLTEVGQICTDVRQEFILLSDIVGLSLLVDSIDHPKPPHSTEGTVLGPFHTHDASTLPAGAAISADSSGVPLLVLCTVKSTTGAPLSGVKIDVWETDSKGKYDVQYEDRGNNADGRAILVSDDAGVFWFKAIVPVPYPIPNDGPVGKLLEKLGRHCWRPSHMHFMFEKEGFDHLVTALYVRGSDYETTDAVFGVKDSLIVALESVTPELAKQYDVEEGTKLLKYDFILVTDDETKQLRHDEAVKAMKGLGREGMLIVNGLPIPDVD